MARLNPNDEDDVRLAHDCWATFNGRGDWWTCHVLRLVAKADPANRARLTIIFDREVAIFEEWERADQDAFARKWGIPRS